MVFVGWRGWSSVWVSWLERWYQSLLSNIIQFLLRIQTRSTATLQSTLEQNLNPTAQTPGYGDCVPSPFHAVHVPISLSRHFVTSSSPDSSHIPTAGYVPSHNATNSHSCVPTTQFPSPRLPDRIC